MEQNLYSIYDSKGCFYGCPFSAVNDGLALRVFHSLIFSPDTDYSRYPEDFCLFHVGVFDNNSSVITSCNPRLIISADQAIRNVKALQLSRQADEEPISETVES